MKNNILLFFGILSVLFLASCGGTPQASDNQLFDSIVNKNKVADVPPEVLGAILKSVPSPIEMNSIILESGAQFNEQFLNPSSNRANYSTVYKQAVNLGIYGADMGYLNIYEKTVSSLAYLEAIIDLSTNLKVNQFFDFTTFKRLSQNKKNVDSILYISTSSFDKMSNFLRNQNRSHISALILIGGWLEGIYLSTQVYKATPTDKLKERIGEQKIPVNDITALLTVYEKNNMFADLAKDIKELKAVYDNVQITYTVGEASVEVVNGALIVKDNRTSQVTISAEQLVQIEELVKKIRNKIIL